MENPTKAKTKKSYSDKFAEYMDEKLRSRGVVTETAKRIKTSGFYAWRTLVGPEVGEASRNLINDFDDHARTRASLKGQITYAKWMNEYRGLKDVLSDLYVDGKSDSLRKLYEERYNGMQGTPATTSFEKPEFIYLLLEMRLMEEKRFYRTVIPDKTVPKDSIKMNRYSATLHADLLGDMDKPDALDLELMGGIDPAFEIIVEGAEQNEYSLNSAIGINPQKLRYMLTKSPEVKADMVIRNYPVVSEGKPITMAYKLSQISGRDKEPLGVGRLYL